MDITISPTSLLTDYIDPALYTLSVQSNIPISDEARVECLTIAGQESNWQYRKQQGGPARSFWQFEKGGGVAGVLSHAASATKIKTFCGALLIPCTTDTVYEAMAWNDFLAAVMARLLLFTDPAPLPKLGNVQGGWDYYLRNWRPGAPHPDVWPGLYQKALDLVTAHPLAPFQEGASV